LTYRELQHLADGRQEAGWGYTAALLAGHQKVMTGHGPKLIDLIPERYRRDDAVLTDDQDAEAADLAFAELESGLKALSRKRE